MSHKFETFLTPFPPLAHSYIPSLMYLHQAKNNPYPAPWVYENLIRKVFHHGESSTERPAWCRPTGSFENVTLFATALFKVDRSFKVKKIVLS